MIVLIYLANLQWSASLIKYIQKTISILVFFTSLISFFVFHVHAQEIFELEDSLTSSVVERRVDQKTDSYRFPTLNLLEKYKGEEEYALSE